MASLLPNGRQAYTDGNGLPLVGGLLYTYEPGTTTFKNTYTTAAATTPNANPIVLNARGEATVYWSGNYKIKLTTALGVEIYTEDNIAEPVSALTLSGTTGSGLIGFLYAATYGAGTIGKWLQDLALSTGASFIGYISSVAGSIVRTVQSVLREDVRLLDFIPEAQHAAILAHTSTYDASDDIIACIAAAAAIPGGANIKAPRGKFKCTKEIPYSNLLVISGKSKKATIFEFNHTGRGFVSLNTINGSTAAHIGLANCTVHNSNASNTGGGFVDVAGTYVDVTQVKITGFKYGVIFDQTEIATIDACDITSPAGGSGIWLVNGPDYTPLAQTNFTNRITITRNQFNADPAAVANILDDGGVSHSIRDNNFNAGMIGIRAAGAYAMIISGNEIEVHGTSDIFLADTTASGTYVGPCSGYEITTNTAISGAGGYNIGIQNAMNGRISSNFFGQAVAAINFLNGAANQSTGNIIEGNTKILSGGGITSGIFVSGASRSLRNNSIRQTAVTYSALSALVGTVTITPATMEFIGVGTRLHLMNADGTNGEDTVVTATTSTTFTATLATAKSALFQIYGATPQDQEEGAWATPPALIGGTTAGAHVYSAQAGQFSRRGNKVHVKGVIAISVKDAAMAGSLSIAGLPFTSENVTNGFAFSNVALYGGFTLAGGYTHLSGVISPGSNTIDLRKSGSGVALNVVPATDCPGGTIDLYFDAEYLTSAL